jgi:hypothetical protein
MAEPTTLRECLEEITITCEDERLAACKLSEQITRIAELKTRFPHSISLVQAAVRDEPRESRFNCYAHSFGLARDQRVLRAMAEHYPRIFPGRQFVQTLVDGRLQSVSADETVDGDHVVYLSNQIEHAGIVREGRVESKWGLGHIWHHGEFEVPVRYGDSVLYFRRLDREVSVRAFLEYAREYGVK